MGFWKSHHWDVVDPDDAEWVLGKVKLAYELVAYYARYGLKRSQQKFSSFIKIEYCLMKYRVFQQHSHQSIGSM